MKIMKLKLMMKHNESPLASITLLPLSNLYCWLSPLMRWAPGRDTAGPSPAAGGSTSPGHPGPGCPVPSSHWSCWGLVCMTPQWFGNLGPNIPKPWGRGAAAWGGGYTRNTRVRKYSSTFWWLSNCSLTQTCVWFGKSLNRWFCSSSLMNPKWGNWYQVTGSDATLHCAVNCERLKSFPSGLVLLLLSKIFPFVSFEKLMKSKPVHKHFHHSKL